MSKSLHTGGQRVNGGPQRQTNQIWPDPIVHSLWWQVSTFNKHFNKTILTRKPFRLSTYSMILATRKPVRLCMNEQSHTSDVTVWLAVFHTSHIGRSNVTIIPTALSHPYLSHLGCLHIATRSMHWNILPFTFLIDLDFWLFSIWCSLGSPKRRKWSNHS